jgi:riboflavin synthase
VFTGIIEEIGTVRAIRKGSKSARIEIAAERVTSDLKPGDSVSTDGVCLTVTSCDTAGFTADVMPETMKRSGLGGLKPGSRVNLERALRLSDRLGGHLVSGHIDGTGTIAGKREDDNAIRFTIRAEAQLLKYIAEKGSVAVDGISLTVSGIAKDAFEVSVIPFTQAETTLSTKKTGDPVNIECDMIARYVEKLLTANRKEPVISANFLRENGFL